jgi:hypothetical protein
MISQKIASLEARIARLEGRNKNAGFGGGLNLKIVASNLTKIQDWMYEPVEVFGDTLETHNYFKQAPDDAYSWTFKISQESELIYIDYEGIPKGVNRKYRGEETISTYDVSGDLNKYVARYIKDEIMNLNAQGRRLLSRR